MTHEPAPGVTNPGGGREDSEPVHADPSHHPGDGAPSPGPQPGANDPDRPAADLPTET